MRKRRKAQIRAFEQKKKKEEQTLHCTESKKFQSPVKMTQGERRSPMSIAGVLVPVHQQNTKPTTSETLMHLEM